MCRRVASTQAQQCLIGDPGKKEMEEPRNECMLCSTGKFISTPVRHHAVRHHMTWCVVPEYSM